jgi:ABC-2 type transport system ATP-binding protein
MSTDHAVYLDKVSKVFYTRHILKRDEETDKRKLYRKQTVSAMKEISLSIEAGEIFGLLGPNGAGKTTTLKTISGLVRPTSGRVWVAGLDVERKRLKVLRRIGVVLEGVRTVIWPLTPLENLAYFGNLKDVRGRVLKRRSRDLLEFMGLKDKMNVQVRRLSRGEKQKLAICIALIADPPVILLDEPTTGLDVQSSRAIKDRIIEMTRRQGKCVLVTTHDMHVAQEVCDRIGIINKGQLVACKATADLLSILSEQVYEFRLDRRPDADGLSRIPGVLEVLVPPGNEALLMIRIEPEEELRSEALYAAIDRLRSDGYQLRSINQVKQNLENVFLHLTNASL